MPTDDTENYYIITRTITDVHGGIWIFIWTITGLVFTRISTECHGGIINHHTDNHGVKFSHVRLRMSTEEFGFSYGQSRNVTEDFENNGAYNVSLEYLWISVIIRVITK